MPRVSTADGTTFAYSDVVCFYVFPGDHKMSQLMSVSMHVCKIGTHYIETDYIARLKIIVQIRIFLYPVIIKRYGTIG